MPRLASYVGKTKSGSIVAQGARRAPREPQTRHPSTDSIGARGIQPRGLGPLGRTPSKPKTATNGR